MPPAIIRRTWRGGAWTTWGYPEAATLTTALTGTNNDLTYTAVAKNANTNNIRVRYVVAGASTPLSVSVATVDAATSAYDITVNVATNGSSAATSTAAQVRDAVNAHVTANTLVTAANATGNDGTGVVTALAYTNLTAGRTGGVGIGTGNWKRVGPFGRNM